MIVHVLKSIPALIKYKVSIAVTFTALTGFIVFNSKLDVLALKLAFAVFVLASGSSALNQFQEWKFDAIMNRTKHRPIPSGEISPITALLISVLFIVSGLVLLFSGFGIIPALLGLFNIVWYNLLYTNLKRVTSFAVVPGSLVGAVPVFIGWTAAGGNLFSSTIVFIGFFLFVWQIPHFWLLMLKYGKEYEEAGFPTVNQSFNPISLRNIIFSWIVATSFSAILIPLFLVKLSGSFFLVIFVLNILFIIFFAKLSFGKEAQLNFKKSFIGINIYMMLFMILLMLFHLY
jgi:protoheme IX farnesyltransferase